ncbi:unnamed protein product [Anisakis simplex]|uniref:PH domain-containing protein n=1 Tax=Anisakis simplex TaxID=6269 RepID=A0A0M3K9N4_ANISI|nr:unnamed protein product [Anisakis simplex]
MNDKHQLLPNMHFVLPGRDLHQEQDLPLRSDWRFPESGAIVFGNVEIRRTLALFWTRVYNRFCAITDHGLLLIYGDNERGIAIDLKDLRGIHSNIVDKKLSNGTFMPRCLITLRHKCGDSLVMCVRGKNEIAKWRCAIWSVIQSDDHQHSSIAPSHALNRRSVSVSNATDASNFHLTPPTDPDEVDYWNNPASGKPMTSPKIYRALSQHASMHRSAMNTSASHSKLAISSSFCYGNRKSFRKASVSPQKELFLKKASTAMDILSCGRSTQTLPSKATTSHENQPHFRIGSLRVEKNSSTSPMQCSPSGDDNNRSPKGGLSSTEETIAQQTHVKMESQSSPQARPSTASSDSGVASRAESPSKMILSSEGVSSIHIFYFSFKYSFVAGIIFFNVSRKPICSFERTMGI